MSKFAVVVALVLVAFAAPSLQFGTLFADNLTPVRWDATYIEGISSVLVNAESSSIGTLTTTNRGGFFINSQGPITTSSDNVYITTAQGVNFVATSNGTSTTTVSSGGSISMSGSRLDVDANTVTMDADQDVRFTSDGYLRIQGESVSISSNQASSIMADENDLLIDAAKELSISAGGTVSMTYNNSISIMSDVGMISFNAADDVFFGGNVVDMRSENSFVITSTGNQEYTAQAVVDLRADQFLSLAAGVNMVIDVDFGDFVVDAAANAGFYSNSTIVYNSNTVAHFGTFGDSESLFEIIANDMVFDADDSVFMFSGINNADIEMFAGGSLTTTSTFDQSFFAFEDFYVNAVLDDVLVNSSGDLDISAGQVNTTLTAYSHINFNPTVSTAGITFNAGDSFVAYSFGDSVLATNGDATINTNHFKLQQYDDDLVLNNNLVITIANDFDLFSPGFEMDTAGLIHAQTTGTGDMDFEVAYEDLYIESYHGPNDVKFMAGEDLSVTLIEGQLDQVGAAIKYSAASMSITAVNFALTTENSGQVLMESGTDMTWTLGDEFVVYASRDYGMQSISGDINQDVVGNVRLTSYSSSFTAYDGDLDAGASASTEISGNTDLNLSADSVDMAVSNGDLVIQADASMAFTSDTADLSGEDVELDVDNAIFMTQNLPSDDIHFTASDSILINSEQFNIQAGGDLPITANTMMTVTALDDISFWSFGTYTLDVDSLSTMINDTLTVDADGAIYVTASNMYFEGEDVDFGPSVDAKYPLGTFDVYADTFLNFTLNEAYSEASVEGNIDVVADDSILISTNGEIGVRGSTSFTMSTADFMDLNATAVSLVAGDMMTFYAGDDYTLQSEQSIIGYGNSFDIMAYSSYTTNSDTTIISAEDIWLQLDTLVLNADDLDVHALDDISVISNDYLNFNTLDDINIISDFLDFIATVQYTLTGDTVVVDNTGGSSDITLLSGGSTSIGAGGSIVFSFEDPATVRNELLLLTSNSGNINFSSGLVDTIVDAHDGELSIHATGGSFTATSEVGDILFSAARNVRLTGEMTFASEGIIPGSTNAISGSTTAMDGNIGFQTTLGQIEVIAAGLYTLGSQNGITSFMSHEDTLISSTGDPTNLEISTPVGDMTIISSIDQEQASAGDFVMTVAGTTNIQSTSGNIQFNAGDNIPGGVNALVFHIDVPNGEFVLSTGQGGDFDIVSDMNFTADAQQHQIWTTTEDYLTTVDEATNIQSTQGDVHLKTAAGTIHLESLNADLAIDVNGAKFLNGGSDIIYDADEDFFLTVSQGGLYATATTGSVIIDGGPADEILFLANAGTITFDAQGARNYPLDGLYFITEDFLATSTSSEITINAFERVTIGEVSRPDMTINAGGSTTTPGITVVADGATRMITEDDSIVFTAGDNIDVTTTKEVTVVSDSTLTLETTSTLTSPNIAITSDNGNVHFHSDVMSTFDSDTVMTIQANSGQFTIRGTSQDPSSRLYFDASGTTAITANSFTSTAGLLEHSGNNDLVFHGMSSVKILSSPGSAGSIMFDGSDDVYLSTAGDFDLRTIGNDAPIQVYSNQNATSSVSFQTQLSGDVTFDSSSWLGLSGNSSVSISSTSTLTFDSEARVTDDSLEGRIQFWADFTTVQADDQIEMEAQENIYWTGSSLSVTSTGDIAFIGDTDLLFYAEQTGGFDFNAQADVTIENSPGGLGDFRMITNSLYDVVAMVSNTGDITWDVGQNIMAATGDELHFHTSGADNTEGFGFRVQTEATGADILLGSVGDISGEAANLYVTARQGSFYGTSEFDIEWTAGRNVNLQTTATGASTGFNSATYVFQTTFSGATSLFATGENGGMGTVDIIADGIQSGGEYGIRISQSGTETGPTATPRTVLFATFGTDQDGSPGNTVWVNAYESIEFGLEGGNVRFGEIGGQFFGSNSFNYLGQDPRLEVTEILAHGIDSDIVFNTRYVEDGLGSIHILSGILDVIGNYVEDYYIPPPDSQLNIVADGGPAAQIVFEEVSGLVFRGASTFYSYQNNDYLKESDISFITTDTQADIEISTSVDAHYADFSMYSHDVLVQSELDMHIAAVGQEGSPMQIFTEDNSINFSQHDLGLCTYLMTVTNGNFNSQVSWNIVQNGDVIAAGGAPTAVTFTAVPGPATVNMFDSAGNGWDVTQFYVTDFQSGAPVASGTLNAGSFGSVNMNLPTCLVDNGLYINAHDSKLWIAADSYSGTSDADVLFQSRQNMWINANNGMNFDVDNIVSEAGTIEIVSMGGDVNMDLLFLTIQSPFVQFRTSDAPNYFNPEAVFGNDIRFRATRALSISADDDIVVLSRRGGNINFRFGSFMQIDGILALFEYGFLSIPQIQDGPKPFARCNAYTHDNEIVIRRNPNFDDTYVGIYYGPTNVDLLVQDAGGPVSEVLSGFEVSLCVCNFHTAQWNCLGLSDFHGRS